MGPDADPPRGFARPRPDASSRSTRGFTDAKMGKVAFGRPCIRQAARAAVSGIPRPDIPTVSTLSSSIARAAANRSASSSLGPPRNSSKARHDRARAKRGFEGAGQVRLVQRHDRASAKRRPSPPACTPSGKERHDRARAKRRPGRMFETSRPRDGNAPGAGLDDGRSPPIA